MKPHGPRRSLCVLEKNTEELHVHHKSNVLPVPLNLDLIVMIWGISDIMKNMVVV